jgi:hypothetical protein
VPKYDKNFYIGKVINNIDPDKNGRCQIKVYGLFDEIPDSDLPWALMDDKFVGSKVGSFIVPPIGAIVRVRFENDDVYFPVYTTKVLDKNNSLNSVSNLNFTGDPNTLIFFATDNGDYFKINTLTKETEYRASNGDFIKIDILGNITVDSSNNPTSMITINAPFVKIAHKVSGTVLPDPTGGPFCALPLEPITGAILQGQIANNI